MNPAAIVLWIVLACIGWLIGNTTGAVVGLMSGMIFSLVIDQLIRMGKI